MVEGRNPIVQMCQGVQHIIKVLAMTLTILIVSVRQLYFVKHLDKSSCFHDCTLLHFMYPCIIKCTHIYIYVFEMLD